MLTSSRIWDHMAHGITLKQKEFWITIKSELCVNLLVKKKERSFTACSFNDQNWRSKNFQIYSIDCNLCVNRWHLRLSPIPSTTIGGCVAGWEWCRYDCDKCVAYWVLSISFKIELLLFELQVQYRLRFWSHHATSTTAPTTR